MDKNIEKDTLGGTLKILLYKQEVKYLEKLITDHIENLKFTPQVTTLDTAIRALSGGQKIIMGELLKIKKRELYL